MNSLTSANHCEKPTVPLFRAVSCAIAFAMTASPALFDGFFNRLDDELTGLVLSTAIGLAIAITIVWSILGGFKNTFVNRKHSYSFYGGLSACIALALLRFWAAGDSGWAILLAISLFLLELAIVLFCEDTVSGLRIDYRNYLVIKGNLERQTVLVDARRLCVERTKKTIDDLTLRKDAIKKHIGDRISRRGQIEPLKKLAISVVLDGYQAGLAEIEGRYHINWKVDDEFLGDGK